MGIVIEVFGQVFMGILVRNIKAWSTHHYGHSFPSDSHKGKQKNHDGLGSKKEKSLREKRRLGKGEERGQTKEKEEGRKGKQWPIIWPPRFQTSGSQSAGPQAKWQMVPF